MEVKKLNSSPIAVAKHYEKKPMSLYSTIDRYLRVSGVYANRQVAFLRIIVGGVEDRMNGGGAKGTREGGKLVIPAIECARLQEAEEGWCRNGGNPKRFESDQ